jgi:hypothetical protein
MTINNNLDPALLIGNVVGREYQALHVVHLASRVSPMRCEISQ